MANSPNSEPKVPAALVAEHRNEWHNFTRAIVISCVSVAALLLLMLIFLRIL